MAATPLILRVLPASSGESIAVALPLVAAIFLSFSFGFQVWLNEAFFAQQKRSRSVWQRLLSPHLSKEEFEEFSSEPIDAAMATYKSARSLVAVAYVALIAILLLLALSALSAELPTTAE